MGVVSLILNFLGGSVVGQLKDAYKAKLEAQNDEQRIAADIRIKELEGLQAGRAHAKEIRLAAAGFWEMRLITFVIAACFASHLVLVTLDTNFGWFSTWCRTVAGKVSCGIPAYPAPFDEWEGAILLSFFGIYTIGKGIQSVAAAIAARRR